MVGLFNGPIREWFPSSFCRLKWLKSDNWNSTCREFWPKISYLVTLKLSLYNTQIGFKIRETTLITLDHFGYAESSFYDNTSEKRVLGSKIGTYWSQRRGPFWDWRRTNFAFSKTTFLANVKSQHSLEGHSQKKNLPICKTQLFEAFQKYPGSATKYGFRTVETPIVQTLF